MWEGCRGRDGRNQVSSTGRSWPKEDISRIAMTPYNVVMQTDVTKCHAADRNLCSAIAHRRRLGFAPQPSLFFSKLIDVSCYP